MDGDGCGDGAGALSQSEAQLVLLHPWQDLVPQAHCGQTGISESSGASLPTVQ